MRRQRPARTPERRGRFHSVGTLCIPSGSPLIETVPLSRYPFVPLSLSHLSRGSRASRSPSPSKFSASTVMKIARPGHTAIHGAVPRYACAILSMDPHDGVGGCVPSPRNRSEEHTSELQSRGHLVCRLLLEKKNTVVTSAPTASTIPAPSCPSTIGRSSGKRPCPSTTCRSLWHTPVATVRTSTSRGSGLSIS